MNLLIDIATLNSVSATFYFILLVLLLIFWRQNRDIDAIIWWCGFPFFRLINALIGSDAIEYDLEFIVYIGNVSILLSDTSLMVGCLKFTENKTPWKIISVYMSAFIILCVYQHGINADLALRTKGIIIFDIIPIIASIYALSQLDNRNFAIEKMFTIFWLAFGVGIFVFWVLIDFEFNNPRYDTNVVLSLALAYLSHIFITVGLIILTIAARRSRLMIDITINKALEHDLEQTLEEAQIANEEKNQFLTNMSHELRTPLNTIIGYAESLKLGFYGDLNDRQKEYIENIYSGGELLLKLITDLLDLSDVEEGKIEIMLEEVNLTRLFDKTLPLLKEIVGKKSNRLKVINSISELEEPPTIQVDQIRTKQILINFMSNAVKYSEQDTPITLEVSEHDDAHYRISITDKGRGIDKDQRDNIFKPFNRAGITDKNIEGIGVGLSIAKSLIEEMHGSIGFKSKVGKGSSFWIDIPKSKQRQLPIG